jgi:hypothetical protein
MNLKYEGTTIIPLTPQPVHHLADIAQASPALRIFNPTLAIAKLLFHPDLFHNRGPLIIQIVLFYILG